MEYKVDTTLEFYEKAKVGFGMIIAGEFARSVAVLALPFLAGI